MHVEAGTPNGVSVRRLDADERDVSMTNPEPLKGRRDTLHPDIKIGETT
jgi:hypothetical protein